MKFGKLLLTATVGSLLFLNFGCEKKAAGTFVSDSDEKEEDCVGETPKTKYRKEQLAEIKKAKAFLKKADLKYPAKEMVRMACVAGDLKALNTMKKNGCRWFKEQEALFAAAGYGRLECCKFLIQEGADVNVKDKSGWTVLHAGAGSGSVELCKYLVSQGLDVNAKNKDGFTVLHTGAASGRVEVCKYLVSQGADVNAKDSRFGWTALHFGATSGSVELCKYLVSQGADVNAKDKDGFTALHYGAASGRVEVCKYLISQGLDVNAKNNYGWTALDKTYSDEVRQYLISQGAKKGSELR